MSAIAEEAMADYFARVELRGTRSREDYDHLYNQMKVAGFYAMMVNPDGAGITLPAGTYASHGSYATVKLAHDAVRRAVTATGFRGSIIVVEFSEWQSSDL